MCLICGNPNCPNTGRESDVILAALTGGLTRNNMGILVDSTTIEIDENGSVRRFRNGFTTKEIPLKEVPGIPDSVADSFDEYFRLSSAIRDKETIAAFLSEKAAEIKRAARQQRVKLRFKISEILPAGKQEHFGDQRLRLQGDRENGPIRVILPDYDDAGFEIDETIGRQLLLEQEEIKFQLDMAEGMAEYAKELAQQVRTLPDLLEIRWDEANRLFEEHVLPELEKNGEILSGQIGFRKSGEVVIDLDYRVEEDGTEIPEDERNMIKALIDLDVSRGGKLSLGTRIKQALGFGTKPEIAETTDAPVGVTS